jgi:hypothetical protein
MSFANAFKTTDVDPSDKDLIESTNTATAHASMRISDQIDGSDPDSMLLL